MSSKIEWTGKWCTACKATHDRDAFGLDASRGDGLAARCLASRRVTIKKKRTVFKRHGRLVPARDGDKKQARRRVNYLVEQGRFPSPNALPCTDCGHLADDRRHEYDHHLGYAAEHHENVEAVCSVCHRWRAIERGEWSRAS